MQQTAATGTGFVRDIHDDLDPGQMRGKCAAIALRRCAIGRLSTRRRRLRRFGRGLQSGHLFGHRLFQILGCLLQCFVVERLRSPAEAVSFQAGALKLQPLDLGQRRAQDRLQCRGIVGQVCGCFEHPRRLTRRCESGPMNPA
jgi:hypothetical protein